MKTSYLADGKRFASRDRNHGIVPRERNTILRRFAGIGVETPEQGCFKLVLGWVRADSLRALRERLRRVPGVREICSGHAEETAA